MTTEKKLKKMFENHLLKEKKEIDLEFEYNKLIQTGSWDANMFLHICCLCMFYLEHFHSKRFKEEIHRLMSIESGLLDLISSDKEIQYKQWSQLRLINLLVYFEDILNFSDINPSSVIKNMYI